MIYMIVYTLWIMTFILCISVKAVMVFLWPGCQLSPKSDKAENPSQSKGNGHPKRKGKSQIVLLHQWSFPGQKLSIKTDKVKKAGDYKSIHTNTNSISIYD